MRGPGWVLIALLAGCGDGTSPAPAGGAAPGLPTTTTTGEELVVATVDGHPITLERLQDAVDGWGTVAEPRALLEDLVTLEVLAREAERLGLAVDPEVRTAAAQARVRRLIEDEFERRTRPEDVPEADLRRAYGENRSFYNNPDVMLVTHLLAPVDRKEPPERWEAARVLLEELRVEVLALEERSAASLRELAKRHEARWQGLRAENLRWIGRRSPLVKEFLDAAFALEADGEVSPPTKTIFGWHLILREDFEVERRQPFETVLGDVRERMYPAWRRHKFLEWVDGRVEEWAIVDPDPLAGLRPARQPKH